MNTGSPNRQDQGATYEIQVQGSISQRWVDWFGCMTNMTEKEDPSSLTTAEVYVADQAALLGQLQKLHKWT
jgi:hypothetical protein